MSLERKERYNSGGTAKSGNSQGLRLAVIGAGHMGAYHINVLSNFNDINLKGFYDSDAKRRGVIAKEYHIKPYDVLEELLGDVDVVVLATPTSTHYDLGRKILEAGVHVLVEKPLTNSLREAHELCTLAAQRGLKLFVGYVERYNGAVQELQRLVEGPYCWESRRVGPGGMRVQDSGVGLDLLIHDIDICLRTLGGKVVSMDASAVYQKQRGNNERGAARFEDALSAQIVFDHGCLANFFVTRLSHRKERSLVVTNQENTLVLDFTTQEIYVYSLGASKITTLSQEIRYAQESSVQRIFIHKANPLQLELRDFIDTILEDRMVDNAMDLQTLELTLEIVAKATGAKGLL